MNTLEEQRIQFSNRPFLATPLAGMVAWLATGISGLFFSERISVYVLFITTGSIVYLALFISKFTGEHFLDKNKTKNSFDQLFMFTVGQAVLMYGMAIPFFMVDHTSLPLSIGILTGAMWLPFSWMVKHWVGIFHAVLRTVGIVLLWYVFPELRFIAIPFYIILIYVLTLMILRRRKTLKETNLQERSIS